MLADSVARSPGVGSLGPGVHKPGTFLLNLVDFIAQHLPPWRDHPDRRPVESERELTAQLSAHLNSVARRSLDVVQFATEVPDSVRRGRSIDVAVQPCGAPIIVAGRRYTLFEALLPIECKRLPTPTEKGRNEREYVTAGKSTTGGIQRFKLGAHGAAHNLALMIGYVQEGHATQWLQRINQWLTEAGEADALWAGEQLRLVAEEASEVCRLHSTHRREAHLGASIELWHLWIELGSR